MKHYTVTISWVQTLGCPSIWTYNVAALNSELASQESIGMARAQFPQAEFYLVQSVIWDGNSEVL